MAMGYGPFQKLSDLLTTRLRLSFRQWSIPIAVVLSTANASWGQAPCDASGCPDNCAGCRSFYEQYGGGVSGEMVIDPNAQPAPVITDGSASGQPTPAVDPDGSLGSLAPQAGGGAMPAANSLAGLSSGVGASSGIAANAPNMIGDFFSGGFRYGVAFNNANVAIAGGDRRFKWAENNSPFPNSRVFFNYHHFHNSLTDIQGGDQDLNRYTFGLERAFMQGLYSVEVRMPFAGTVDNVQDISAPANLTTEFGNISMAFKTLLYQDRCRALAGGMGIVLPTGDDSPLVQGNQLILNFGNDSVHLQPFIGYFSAPSSNWFHQWFAQLDFDANGNDVVIPIDSPLLSTSINTPIVRTLQDQTLLMLDYSFGYWLHKNQRARYVRGVAGMLELHYTTTLQDLDTGGLNGDPSLNNDVLDTAGNRRDVLNLTSGLFFQLGPLSSLKVAAVTPLRDGEDKLFDTEFGVQFNRRY